MKSKEIAPKVRLRPTVDVGACALTIREMLVRMNYSTGGVIRIGDHVVADGMRGVVVCDFDHREFLEGFADWDAPNLEMLGGGTLSKGVMIRTEEAGLIHYEDEAEGIALVRPAPT